MGGERGHAPANLHREDGEWPRLEASLRHDAVVQEGHGGGGEELKELLQEVVPRREGDRADGRRGVGER